MSKGVQTGCWRLLFKKGCRRVVAVDKGDGKCGGDEDKSHFHGKSVNE